MIMFLLKVLIVIILVLLILMFTVGLWGFFTSDVASGVITTVVDKDELDDNKKDEEA